MVKTEFICASLDYATMELGVLLNQGYEIVDSGFFSTTLYDGTVEQCFQAILKREVK